MFVKFTIWLRLRDSHKTKHDLLDIFRLEVPKGFHKCIVLQQEKKVRLSDLRWTHQMYVMKPTSLSWKEVVGAAAYGVPHLQENAPR